MAVKKAAGGSKASEGAAAKAKASGTKSASAAKKETAPKTSKAAAPKAAAPKAAAPKAAAAPKKSAVKKAGAAPIKLSASQSDLLRKVSGAAEPGYRSEKKVEQRTLDALQERKLIKRGAKHKESGTYHYQISNAGKKHLTSQPAEGASSTSGTPAGG